MQIWNSLMIALALALNGVCFDAMAWGKDGHRAVAAIADQLIEGSHAQGQIAALLLPGETLEYIANWPDCVKDKYCGAQTPEMLDYAIANPHHARYHYTDIPFQNMRYRDGALGSAHDDIVHTLKQAIAVLQGQRDDVSNPHHFSPRLALILITHLAGDLHQPLHVGVAYIDQRGRFVVPATLSQIDAVNLFNTRGGNDLLLDAAISTPAARIKQSSKSLHAYWDATVVGDAMRRMRAVTPEQFARSAIASQPVVTGNIGDPIGWPYQWADDALRASKLAYAGVVPLRMGWQTDRKGETHRVWTVALPENYFASSTTLAKIQLIKGGYHLAALLQAIWP